MAVPQGTRYHPLGALPFPSTIANAFTADVCNYPWYTATTPALKYFASINKTVCVWEAYVRAVREIHVKAYDHATGTWSATYPCAVTGGMTADDHGVSSIVQDADGYFWVFGRAHNQDMQVTRSNAVNDISAWTEQSVIVGDYAYPHPELVGTRLYLFMRDSSVDPEKTLVLYSAIPSAGVISWGASTTIGDLGADTRWYQGNYIVVGTEIYMSATRANASDNFRKDIFILRYQTADGSVKNLSGSVTTPAASLPLLLTTLNTSYREVITTGDSGNIPGMCFDAAGNLHLAFMDGSFGGIFSTYHKMWNPTTQTWTTPYHVGDTALGDLHRYDALTVAPNGTGGIDYVTVVAATSVPTNRGGDMARATRDSSGNWSPLATLQRSARYALDACVCVGNGRPEFNVAYSQIAYIITLGVTGTESGLTQAYGIGSTDPAAPYVAASPYGPDVYNTLVRLNADPGTTVKNAMKDLVDFYRGTADVGSGGLGLRAWMLRGLIYLFVAPDAPAALLDFRQNRYNLTVSGAPVFAGAYLGYTGVANGYFDTGMPASTYQGTSFSCQVACKNNATTQSLIGTATATDLTLFWDGTTLTTRVAGSETGLASAFSAASGIVGMSRTGTTIAAFGNGVNLGSKTATNQAFTSGNVWVNRRTTLYSVATHYALALGLYGSDTFMAMEAAALKTYLNTVSPGLLP